VSSGHSSLPAHPFWWHNRIYTDNSTGIKNIPLFCGNSHYPMGRGQVSGGLKLKNAPIKTKKVAKFSLSWKINKAKFKS